MIATVVSAVLYGLAFPTTSWRLLAWVALVPWLLALRGASVRRALGLAWLWSVVMAYVVGNWFAPSLAKYYHQSYAVGLLLFFVVSSVTAAPYYAAFAVCYRTLVRRPGVALPLVAGAAWTAAEFARARAARRRQSVGALGVLADRVRSPGADRRLRQRLRHRLPARNDQRRHRRSRSSPYGIGARSGPRWPDSARPPR